MAGGPTHIQHAHLIERDRQITIDVLNGATYSSVAKEYGLAHERIRRIVFSTINKTDHRLRKECSIPKEYINWKGVCTTEWKFCIHKTRRNKDKLIPLIQAKKFRVYGG